MWWKKNAKMVRQSIIVVFMKVIKLGMGGFVDENYFGWNLCGEKYVNWVDFRAWEGCSLKFKFVVKVFKNSLKIHSFIPL